MSTQNVIQAVSALIDAYAIALNAGNAKAIGGFYETDGAILPNGHKTINKKELDQMSGEFFKKYNFKIQYTTPEVNINGEYVIVETVAMTTTTANNHSISKRTRDLFILRNSDGSLKIFRYIFNDSK